MKWSAFEIVSVFFQQVLRLGRVFEIPRIPAENQQDKLQTRQRAGEVLKNLFDHGNRKWYILSRGHGINFGGAVMRDFWKYLDADPEICHGQLRFRGTRVMVHLVLDALSEGATQDEVLAAYPTLNIDHIRAAMAYGAHVAEEEIFLPFSDLQAS